MYKLSNRYDKYFWSHKTTYKQRKRVWKATKNWLNGNTLKLKNGTYYLNVIGCLSEGGDGDDYISAVKRIHHKKVRVLKLGEGAGSYIKGYAYPTRKLAK